MKKKYSWLINLAIICLCIFTIAVGVYAANTAKLTISGNIGFYAHNCKVSVSGYIYGHGMKDGIDHADGLPVGKDNPTPLNNGKAINIEGGVSTAEQSKFDLGARYFTDMQSETGKPENIVVIIDKYFYIF